MWLIESIISKCAPNCSLDSNCRERYFFLTIELSAESESGAHSGKARGALVGRGVVEVGSLNCGRSGAPVTTDIAGALGGV